MPDGRQRNKAGDCGRWIDVRGRRRATPLLGGGGAILRGHRGRACFSDGVGDPTVSESVVYGPFGVSRLRPSDALSGAVAPAGMSGPHCGRRRKGVLAEALHCGGGATRASASNAPTVGRGRGDPSCSSRASTLLRRKRRIGGVSYVIETLRECSAMLTAEVDETFAEDN